MCSFRQIPIEEQGRNGGGKTRSPISTRGNRQEKHERVNPQPSSTEGCRYDIGPEETSKQQVSWPSQYSSPNPFLQAWSEAKPQRQRGDNQRKERNTDQVIDWHIDNPHPPLLSIRCYLSTVRMTPMITPKFTAGDLTRRRWIKNDRRGQ